MHNKIYSLVLLFSNLVQAQNNDPGVATATDGAVAGPGTPDDGICVNGLCLSAPSPPTLPDPLDPQPSDQPQQPQPSSQWGTIITTETVISVQAGPKTTLTVTLPQTRTTTVTEIPGQTVTAGGATFTTITTTEGQPTAQSTTASPITSRETVTVTNFSESTTSAQLSTPATVTTSPVGVGSSSRSNSQTTRLTSATSPTLSFVTVNGAAYPTGAAIVAAMLGGAAAIANL